MNRSPHAMNKARLQQNLAAFPADVMNVIVEDPKWRHASTSRNR